MKITYSLLSTIFLFSMLGGCASNPSVFDLSSAGQYDSIDLTFYTNPLERVVIDPPSGGQSLYSSPVQSGNAGVAGGVFGGAVVDAINAAGKRKQAELMDKLLPLVENVDLNEIAENHFGPILPPAWASVKTTVQPGTYVEPQETTDGSVLHIAGTWDTKLMYNKTIINCFDFRFIAVINRDAGAKTGQESNFTIEVCVEDAKSRNHEESVIRWSENEGALYADVTRNVFGALNYLVSFELSQIGEEPRAKPSKQAIKNLGDVTSIHWFQGVLYLHTRI